MIDNVPLFVGQGVQEFIINMDFSFGRVLNFPQSNESLCFIMIKYFIKKIS
jgi:hypothetical protein